jgi:hypothetical protein
MSKFVRSHFPKEIHSMMTRLLGAVALGAVCMTVACAEELQSGLAVGKVTTPFHPLNVTGDSAGKKNCLV